MRVKLSDIKTYYINPEANKERNDSILEQAGLIGIKDINRFEGIIDEKPLGCAKSHQGVLSRVARANLPVLVLEDDAIINPDYEGDFEFEVPDDADALYLGLISFGISQKDGIKPNKLLVAEEVSEGMYRIKNMLAAHAVVYFTKEYVAHVKEKASEAIKEGVPQDTKRAKTMKDFKVYAVDVPPFVQSGMNIYNTKFNLSNYLFKTSLDNPNINL